MEVLQDHIKAYVCCFSTAGKVNRFSLTAKLDFTLDERICLLSHYSMLGVGANSGSAFSGISYERNCVMNCRWCCPIQFWVLFFILIPIVSCMFALASLKRHFFKPCELWCTVSKLSPEKAKDACTMRKYVSRLNIVALSEFVTYLPSFTLSANADFVSIS